jgi:hypothetical protein
VQGHLLQDALGQCFVKGDRSLPVCWGSLMFKQRVFYSDRKEGPNTGRNRSCSGLIFLLARATSSKGDQHDPFTVPNMLVDAGNRDAQGITLLAL